MGSKENVKTARNRLILARVRHRLRAMFPGHSTGSAIEATNLVKTYREGSPAAVRALDGLSIAVRQGEIFGLLGPNGAGKTTLLRVLTTLTLPTSGSATVLGLDVRAHPLEVRRRICAVLQENAVEVYLSVADNLDTYARFHAVPRLEVRRRIEMTLERFGLSEYRSQKVIDLSGGLKRRVQVAKVFMVDSPLVFLDEATTGMDPMNRRATLQAFREEARRGRTIFLTTHVLQEAEELCNTFAIIDHGRCIAQGDLAMIRGLSSRAFDITVTFDTMTDGLLEELRRLPLLKMEVHATTVTLCVKGREMSALAILTSLARTHTITHFEVTSATLEDVFLELLGNRQPEGQTS